MRLKRIYGDCADCGACGCSRCLAAGRASRAASRSLLVSASRGQVHTMARTRAAVSGVQPRTSAGTSARWSGWPESGSIGHLVKVVHGATQFGGQLAKCGSQRHVPTQLPILDSAGRQIAPLRKVLAGVSRQNPEGPESLRRKRNGVHGGVFKGGTSPPCNQYKTARLVVLGGRFLCFCGVQFCLGLPTRAAGLPGSGGALPGRPCRKWRGSHHRVARFDGDPGQRVLPHGARLRAVHRQQRHRAQLPDHRAAPVHRHAVPRTSDVLSAHQ